MNQIRNRLIRLCDEEFPEDPACTDRVESIEVREGVGAEVILTVATERNCDLIIMGSHEKGFVASTFLGSTGRRVLRRTRKPVFIIPLPAEETDVPFHHR